MAVVVNNITVGTRLNGSKLGRRWRDSYQLCECLLCGSVRWVRVEHGIPRSIKCRECSNKRRGGRHLTWNGYETTKLSKDHPFYSMTDKDGYIRTHRLTLAASLGRPLETWEIVHHKDGNKKNNNLENLELMNNFEHKQFEALIREVNWLRQKVEVLENMLKVGGGGNRR